MGVGGFRDIFYIKLPFMGLKRPWLAQRGELPKFNEKKKLL
jgi:hypothetical protein